MPSDRSPLLTVTGTVTGGHGEYYHDHCLPRLAVAMTVTLSISQQPGPGRAPSQWHADTVTMLEDPSHGCKDYPCDLPWVERLRLWNQLRSVVALNSTVKHTTQ